MQRAGRIEDPSAPQTANGRAAATPATEILHGVGAASALLVAGPTGRRRYTNRRPAGSYAPSTDLRSVRRSEQPISPHGSSTRAHLGPAWWPVLRRRRPRRSSPKGYRRRVRGAATGSVRGKPGGGRLGRSGIKRLKPQRQKEARAGAQDGGGPDRNALVRCRPSRLGEELARGAVTGARVYRINLTRDSPVGEASTGRFRGGSYRAPAAGHERSANLRARARPDSSPTPIINSH